MPENIFLQFSRGKTFKECGAKVISIDRPSGGLLTGALMYAENWNPPVGCWRLSYSEAMNAMKTTDVTNSDEAILPKEVFHSFMMSASSLMAAATAMPEVMVGTGGVPSRALAALADSFCDTGAAAGALVVKMRTNSYQTPFFLGKKRRMKAAMRMKGASSLPVRKKAVARAVGGGGVPRRRRPASRRKSPRRMSRMTKTQMMFVPQAVGAAVADVGMVNPVIRFSRKP